MVRPRFSRLLPFSLLLGNAALGLACAPATDSARADDEALAGFDEAELDDDFVETAPCPLGTHRAFEDPEITGVDPNDAECIADTTCDALSCTVGECVEEGGVAGCACPIGYTGGSCEACADGFVPGADGRCDPSPASVDPTELQATSEGPMLAVSAAGHEVQFGSCGAGSGCADEVPMTGRVSDLFAEVDTAVQQFVKTRCAGSAVLSISRNGERVYKRGFGRMEGAAADFAHCPQSDVTASSAYTLPDTPHQVGSVSKYVTASLVREQIEARIDARGLRWRYADASEALVLDPALELLPPRLLAVLDQTRADAECPPVTTPGACVRAAGCGGGGPDVRWQNMTVGDLFGHTSGLDGAMPQWDANITEVGALRDYTSESDWQADHDALRDRTNYPTQMDTARGRIADLLGESTGDIFFVNNYDAIGGEDPVEEMLEATAGSCLTNPPVGQTDSSPSGANYGYENEVYAVLGRISAHLNGEMGGDGRFSSPNGFPELHEGSALDEFLIDHGLEDGVVAAHSLQTRVSGFAPGMIDPVPQRRSYSSGTYLPRVANKNRPFCVWDGSSCDFTPWATDTNNDIGVRVTWQFDAGGLGFVNGQLVPLAPPSILHNYNTAGQNPAVGGLMAEMPALLRIAGLYRADGSDVHQGLPRQGCTNCPGVGGKNGAMGGARAWVRQIGSGGSRTLALPARDGAGRLRTEPNPANWVDATWSEPDNVDFTVAVSQNADESGFNGYNLDRYVSYALSRVDWDAVDLEMDNAARRVVGMAMNRHSATYTWYADGHREGKENPPDVSGGPSTAPATYTLPSSRTGADIVGVAISSDERTYAWYDDGHRSVGSTRTLDNSASQPVQSYSLPSGQSYSDIVGIAIASNDRVYSWYRDGTRAIGHSYDLDAYGVASYSLPPGQTGEEIVGVAIDWADNSRVYTRFKDGSIAQGRSWNLDAYNYERGEVAGMSMYGGDTTMWYANGYMRRMAGSPAENQVTPTILESGSYQVAPDQAPEDVIAVAEIDGDGARFWYRDGTMSWGASPTTAASWPTWPTTHHSLLVGIGRATNGRIYSWYNTGARAAGTVSNLDANGTYSSYDAPQHEFNIAAIAIDSSGGGDGRVWSIYRDGTVARGRSWNLGGTVWDAP